MVYQKLRGLAQTVVPKRYLSSDQALKNTCKCEDPFCDNHETGDEEDLSQEWAWMDQESGQAKKSIPKQAEKPILKQNGQKRSQETKQAPSKPINAPDDSSQTMAVPHLPPKSTFWQNPRTRARDDLLLLAVVQPPQCDAPRCPLNQAPYNIPHMKGIYVHNGQSLSLELSGHVSKYLMSIIDDFGGSLPPLGIWKAYERMVRRRAEEGDSELVVGFFRSHCTAEACEKLLKRL
ncbi:MAG: hypothetical protein Q9191_001296 [Dirinaria sp. TL-2023a]